MASEASRALEAILMVAQEPVDPHLLAQVLEVAPARVAELCAELQAAYAADDRGFVLVKVAGGYRFQSHEDLAPYVERFVLEGQSARLSSAALETLAIVAYKQPISRAQVAAIRGVNVDGVMRTLQQRGYVEEVARDPGPGQAALFGTTREFLERLGLDRIEELRAVGDVFPAAEVLEALDVGLRPEPRVTDTAPPGDPLDPPAPSFEPSPAAEASWHQPVAAETPSPGGREGPRDEIEVPAWFTEAEDLDLRSEGEPDSEPSGEDDPPPTETP